MKYNTSKDKMMQTNKTNKPRVGAEDNKQGTRPTKEK